MTSLPGYYLAFYAPEDRLYNKNNLKCDIRAHQNEMKSASNVEIRSRIISSRQEIRKKASIISNSKKS